MFSINRVFIAFFLQGIIYIVIMSFMQNILEKPLINNMAIFLYFIFFVPNIIYAIIVESSQRYIKNYISFGIINAFIGIGLLLVDAFIFAQSSVKREALLGYFITYFIVSIYFEVSL